MVQNAWTWLWMREAWFVAWRTGGGMFIAGIDYGHNGDGDNDDHNGYGDDNVLEDWRVDI